MSERSASAVSIGVRSVLRTAWNTLHTIYYANSVAWRALKSGALFLFGFFLWAGSNVVHSYEPSWGFLHYSMAYGLVLVGYGPFHHSVVIPAVIRLRRSGGIRTQIGKHLPNAGLATFLVLVVLLGTFPVGPVNADFQSSSHGGTADVNPTLHCVRYTRPASDATVHCTLTNSGNVGRVVAVSGRTRLAEDRTPPFAFNVSERDVRTNAGARRFTVEVYDARGTLARRYTRRLSMLDNATSGS